MDINNVETRTRTASSIGYDEQNISIVNPRSPLPQKYNLTGTNSGIHQPNGMTTNGRDSGTDMSFIKRRFEAELQDGAGGSSTKSFFLLGIIFLASIVALASVYVYSPNVAEEHKQYIKLPRNIQDAQQLGLVLEKYKDTNYYQVLGGLFVTYIFLQSFAIPGSIFLSILSGFLFPFPIALFLVCLCSGIGASFCFLLFYLVGRRIVWKYMPEKAAQWAAQVHKNREHLLNYIIFLRITPLLPNWFINIVSPVIDVPLVPFFVGTFVGVAPPSFLAIQAGTTLQQLSSSGAAVSWTSIFVLALLAILVMLPVVFKSKLRSKFE